MECHITPSSHEHIDRLVEDCNNFSVANALELLQSCTELHIQYTLKCSSVSVINLYMLYTAQVGGPVLKAFGRVQYTPFQLADKSTMITDQHTAGGSVSQLSQLAKLSPWLTLSTKDITTSFWHYNEWFCFLSNQIMGLYNFSNQIK